MFSYPPKPEPDAKVSSHVTSSSATNTTPSNNKDIHVQLLMQDDAIRAILMDIKAEAPRPYPKTYKTILELLNDITLSFGLLKLLTPSSITRRYPHLNNETLCHIECFTEKLKIEYAEAITSFISAFKEKRETKSPSTTIDNQYEVATQNIQRLNNEIGEWDIPTVVAKFNFNFIHELEKHKETLEKSTHSPERAPYFILLKKVFSQCLIEMTLYYDLIEEYQSNATNRSQHRETLISDYYKMNRDKSASAIGLNTDERNQKNEASHALTHSLLAISKQLEEINFQEKFTLYLTVIHHLLETHSIYQQVLMRNPSLTPASSLDHESKMGSQEHKKNLTSSMEMIKEALCNPQSMINQYYAILLRELEEQKNDLSSIFSIEMDKSVKLSDSSALLTSQMLRLHLSQQVKTKYPSLKELAIELRIKSIANMMKSLPTEPTPRLSTTTTSESRHYLTLTYSQNRKNMLALNILRRLKDTGQLSSQEEKAFDDYHELKKAYKTLGSLFKKPDEKTIKAQILHLNVIAYHHIVLTTIGKLKELNQLTELQKKAFEEVRYLRVKRDNPENQWTDKDEQRLTNIIKYLTTTFLLHTNMVTQADEVEFIKTGSFTSEFAAKSQSSFNETFRNK